MKRFLAKDEYAGTLRELEARAEQLGEDSDRDEHRRVMQQLTRLRTEAQVAAAMRGGGDHLFHPELMAISFGAGLTLLGLPGEFFVETVAEIRERAGVARLPVACYANHYIGYVVPEAAYDEGGYEPGVAILAPEAERIGTDAALSLLQEVMP